MIPTSPGDSARPGVEHAGPRGEGACPGGERWVTLEGEVDYEFQRREVERMVRNVRGVIGVTNSIIVKPAVTPETVEERIEGAFKAGGRGGRASHQG